jgi:hypothetical protein
MLIARKKKCCQIQAIFPECWQKRHLIALIHLKSTETGRPQRLILQGHYSNPRGREAGDEDLNFLIRNV